MYLVYCMNAMGMMPAIITTITMVILVTQASKS